MVSQPAAVGVRSWVTVYADLAIHGMQSRG